MLAETDGLVKVLVIDAAAGGVEGSGAVVGKATSAGVSSVDSTVAVSPAEAGAAIGVQAVTARSKIDVTRTRRRFMAGSIFASIIAQNVQRSKWVLAREGFVDVHLCVRLFERVGEHAALLCRASAEGERN